ncbi:helical backbone metal receptor [Aliikangiella maris]|uniref:Helical backbone metal receptor n=2 Tax=Aliikangiella maris TaxID=3162458 RepID=A0ABV2BW93_9GAMM
MKIISLVPSITETLIDCQVNLVGRSRFCIHPRPQVNDIAKVGGTKDINWQNALDQSADLVILDKEENTLQMAESCPIDYFALHITCIEDVAPELTRLAERIESQPLMAIAKRWQQVAQNGPLPNNMITLPGVIQWWKKPDTQTRLVYLIWQNPWMAIGENTFIQSVLDFCGLKKYRISFSDKYPQIDLGRLAKEDTVLLFSTEPFPFDRYQESLIELGYSCALVDGELFSWYGIRSLKFLESICETAE